MSLINSAAKALFRIPAEHQPRWLCRMKMMQGQAMESDQKFWKLYAEYLRGGATVQPAEDFFNLSQLVERTRNSAANWLNSARTESARPDALRH